ncbi:nuclear transport factor 2 family protein [Erythrobacter rubeus]|uniref:Nuclear transport factor 2 family protein n=1 Tax=Erythrobacter rubeus TaxID=2760803 RepID=A0ABR8KRM9_9SPHN|nr:nuclear transport factor 2 family protein [Erythrobacter rubeus]MBD2842594.1 nuclear transport factor 2 family protein [Erythrobacter rubeus]
MSDANLSPEHAGFFERFKSYWADPSGERVGEIIAPDATIHFTGAGFMSGAEYATWMGETLAGMDELVVTPMDCAGNEDMLYIAWESKANIHGERRTYRGVDRFKIKDGMAIEEHVIFDSAVLTPEGRGGIEHK